jgi:cell division protein ZapE
MNDSTDIPEGIDSDPTAGLSVIEIYQHALEKRGFQADASQYRAVERLQQLYDEWVAYKYRRRNALLKLIVKPPLPRGVYLWGGVGRGKSFLMDSFYQALPVVRKNRVHFHHFMRDVHRQLEELKGQPNPLDALARRIALRWRIICFDEMHVNDIADAMIVGRLLQRTMDLGVVYCMTSNYRPDDLYKDGLKRDDFMPTIALIKKRLDVVNVDSGVDYRKRALEQVEVYLTPAGPAADQRLMQTFTRVAEVEEESPELLIEERTIACRHCAGGVVWLDFAVICGWGRSQHDYLELAKRFHTVIVSNVPRIGLESVDEGRRFTLLVDILYDNRIKLIISAEAEPERLLKIEEGSKDARIRAMKFEFDRTASRLVEMQSKEYLAEQRRAA